MRDLTIDQHREKGRRKVEASAAFNFIPDTACGLLGDTRAALLPCWLLVLGALLSLLFVFTDEAQGFGKHPANFIALSPTEKEYLFIVCEADRGDDALPCLFNLQRRGRWRRVRCGDSGLGGRVHRNAPFTLGKLATVC